ncbi:MAG: hypothetical protein MJZ93_00040 [Paludibacteraceae bacterium]|nr:hypothetical protein [Paludibacteraceae bacterium]
MRSVDMPASLTAIMEQAFYGSNELTTIVCRTATPIVIPSNVFTNYDANLYVPEESVDAYETATHWKNFNMWQPTADNR